MSKLSNFHERAVNCGLNGVILCLFVLSVAANVYFFFQTALSRIDTLRSAGILLPFYLLTLYWRKTSFKKGECPPFTELDAALLGTPAAIWISPIHHLYLGRNTLLIVSTVAASMVFIVLGRRNRAAGVETTGNQSTAIGDSLKEDVIQENPQIDVQMEAMQNCAAGINHFPNTHRSRSVSSLESCEEADEESLLYESSSEASSEENVPQAIAEFSKGACDRLFEGARSLVNSARGYSKSHSGSELTGRDFGGFSPHMSSYDYESSDGKWNADESESSELYRPGGYHPTVHGEIFNYRYVALEKIGWGECSIVWLAKDTKNNDQLVALKISRASVLYKNCAINEAHICTIMRDRLKRADKHYDQVKLNSSCVMEMYDSFEHEGPHGVHFVSVLERLGPNLLALMTLTEFRGLPTTVVRYIAKRILHGLTFLHDEINVCHADIKPENILLVSGLSETPGPVYLEYSVKVSDLGSGRILDYSYPLSVLQTREYRAPEVLMGCEKLINQAIDVWSLGCVIFELLTGDFLFDPKSQVESSRAQDLLQMNLIMQVSGEVPRSLLQSARYGGHFFRKGAFVQERLPRIDLKNVMVSSYNMSPKEAQSFCDFLLPMLEIDPSKRVKARDHTQHEWLQLTADQLNEVISL